MELDFFDFLIDSKLEQIEDGASCRVAAPYEYENPKLVTLVNVAPLNRKSGRNELLPLR